jgi:hypothetical protein
MELAWAKAYRELAGDVTIEVLEGKWREEEKRRDVERKHQLEVLRLQGALLYILFARVWLDSISRFLALLSLCMFSVQPQSCVFSCSVPCS